MEWIKESKIENVSLLKNKSKVEKIYIKGNVSSHTIFVKYGKKKD